MATDYIPILIMIVVAVGFSAVALTISWLLGPSKSDPSKDSTYECGMDPIGDARDRYSVRLYVVAMLFIIFDLETIFLLPWAVVFKQNAMFFLMEMFVFLGILIVGYIYVWRIGALDWNSKRGRIMWEPRHDA